MPDEAPDHFLQASPIEMLPFRFPQHNIVGDKDNPFRLDMIRWFTERAQRDGDPSELTILEGAGHFELVSTHSAQWPKVRDIILSMAKHR